MLAIGDATPESVAKKAAELGGTTRLARAAERVAEDHAEQAPWVAGAAWELAYTAALQETGDKAARDRMGATFAASGGNMLATLATNHAGNALFFATYPQAAGCIRGLERGDSVNPLLAVSSIVISARSRRERPSAGPVSASGPGKSKRNSNWSGKAARWRKPCHAHAPRPRRATRQRARPARRVRTACEAEGCAYV